MEKKPDQFKLFKNYMVGKRGWIKVSETEFTVTYEKQIKPSKGSFLIALFLMLFLIIPGILYLYYSNKPGHMENLSVEVISDGTLKGSGTSAGMTLFRYFQTVRAVKDHNKV